MSHRIMCGLKQPLPRKQQRRNFVGAAWPRRCGGILLYQWCAQKVSHIVLVVFFGADPQLPVWLQHRRLCTGPHGSPKQLTVSQLWWHRGRFEGRSVLRHPAQRKLEHDQIEATLGVGQGCQLGSGSSGHTAVFPTAAAKALK
jgi:hypothetical protein